MTAAGQKPQPHYPVVDGNVVIEIRLERADQVVSDYSPVPWNPRGLHPAVEEYLTATVQDFPKNTRFHLIFRVPRGEESREDIRTIPGIVEAHYRSCCTALDRQYRQWTRFGRRYLVLALLVLTACTFLSRSIVMHFGETLPVTMAADGFTILGWAVVWAPITVLLDEIWPLWEKRKTYAAILAARIEVLPEP